MLQTIADSEIRLSASATELDNLFSYINSLKAAGSSYADVAYSRYLIFRKDYDYLSKIQAVLKGQGLASDTTETKRQSDDTAYMFTASKRETAFLVGIANGWNTYADYISVEPIDITRTSLNQPVVTAPGATSTKTNIGLGLGLLGLLYLFFGRKRRKA